MNKKELAIELIKIKKQQKELKIKEDEIKEKLVKEFEINRNKVQYQGISVRFRAERTLNIIDTQRLKSNNPEIYRECKKEILQKGYIVVW